MEIKFEFGSIVGKKTGATYQGIYLQLSDTYKKFVILNDAEICLLKTQNNEMVKPTDFPFDK